MGCDFPRVIPVQGPKRVQEGNLSNTTFKGEQMGKN